MEKEWKEVEEKSVNHLEIPSDTCKVANDDSEDIMKSFCISSSSISILLGTDDIPLIDDAFSGDVSPEAALVPRTRPESWTTAHTTSPVIPCRNSVVSYNPASYTPVSTTLPTKQAAVLSPDVFHLRFPLVSAENLGTPPGSRENIPAYIL